MVERVDEGREKVRDVSVKIGVLSEQKAALGEKVKYVSCFSLHPSSSLLHLRIFGSRSTGVRIFDAIHSR